MNNFQNLLALDSSQAGQLILRLITPENVYDAPKDVFFESQLIPEIDDLLKKASLSLKQIDAFVVGKGPGSFMGLRLGFSVFRTWAWIYDKPITSVSSLDLLSYSFLNTHCIEKDTIIIPCIDGKMNRVFTNIQECEQYYLEDSDISPQQLVQYIQELPTKNIIIIGSGAKFIQELLTDQEHITYDTNYQLDTNCFTREFIQSLNQDSFSTKSKDFLTSIEPHYIRLSAAEETALKKKKDPN